LGFLNVTNRKLNSAYKKKQEPLLALLLLYFPYIIKKCGGQGDSLPPTKNNQITLMIK